MIEFTHKIGKVMSIEKMKAIYVISKEKGEPITLEWGKIFSTQLLSSKWISKKSSYILTLLCCAYRRDCVRLWGANFLVKLENI